jgi:hypothetical protein
MMTTTKSKPAEVPAGPQPDSATLSIAAAGRQHDLRILEGRRADAVDQMQKGAFTMSGMARDPEQGRMQLQAINELEERILELSALEGRALADRYCQGWYPEPQPPAAGLNLTDALARGRSLH